MERDEEPKPVSKEELQAEYKEGETTFTGSNCERLIEYLRINFARECTKADERFSDLLDYYGLKLEEMIMSSHPIHNRDKEPVPAHRIQFKSGREMVEGFLIPKQKPFHILSDIKPGSQFLISLI